MKSKKNNRGIVFICHGKGDFSNEMQESINTNDKEKNGTKPEIVYYNTKKVPNPDEGEGTD